jgi:hypothetical protein
MRFVAPDEAGYPKQGDRSFRASVIDPRRAMREKNKKNKKIDDETKSIKHDG